jgi:hypothetical protein
MWRSCFDQSGRDRFGRHEDYEADKSSSLRSVPIQLMASLISAGVRIDELSRPVAEGDTHVDAGEEGEQTALGQDRADGIRLEDALQAKKSDRVGQD